MYGAIDHLKRAGNPHYQFYDDPKTYEERCVNNDDDDLIADNLHPDEPTSTDKPESEDESEKDAEKEQQEEDAMIRDEEEYRTGPSEEVPYQL